MVLDRAPGREHFPLYPQNFIAIRIVQLVLAVIILGLDAYGLSLLSFTGDELNMFTVSSPHRPVLTIAPSHPKERRLLLC